MTEHHDVQQIARNETLSYVIDDGDSGIQCNQDESGTAVVKGKGHATADAERGCIVQERVSSRVFPSFAGAVPEVREPPLENAKKSRVNFQCAAWS